MRQAVLNLRCFIGSYKVINFRIARCAREYWYYSRQNRQRGGVSAGAGLVPFFRLNEQLVVRNRRRVYPRRDRSAHRLIKDLY